MLIGYVPVRITNEDNKETRLVCVHVFIGHDCCGHPVYQLRTQSIAPGKSIDAYAPASL